MKISLNWLKSYIETSLPAEEIAKILKNNPVSVIMRKFDGAQWNADGIQHSGHYNNILFAVCSPEGAGWYFSGAMTLRAPEAEDSRPLWVRITVRKPLG